MNQQPGDDPVFAVKLEPGGPMPPVVAVGESPKKRNRLVQYWKKAGGGSFMLSLAIHCIVLVVAFFVVETIVTEDKVDFLPGGGSKSGEKADQQLSQQVQTKRRSAMQKTTPMQRVVSTSTTASMTLPDMPVDSIAVPSMSSFMGGGSMGGGGFGKGGFGGGSGSGVGIGAMQGFMARTIFGRIGGEEGLPGKLYDFKQDRNRKPLTYNPGMYGPALGKAASRRYSNASLREYYRAKQEVRFSYLTIPNMRAEEGPKAFNVEKEVEPRGWFVHYSGTITAPKAGEWRFVGLFDDVLIVYINNKVVLDGGYAFFSNFGGDKPDEDVRQEFGQNMFGDKYPTRAGKWVRIGESARIDIIVGEVPGAAVGGALFVQHKDTEYKKRDNGTPILPVFSTAKLDKEDVDTIQNFAKKTRFAVDENTPIFTVKKSVFDSDEKEEKESSLMQR